MAYKCESCGNTSEDAGECCGKPMVEVKTEAKTEETTE